MGQKRYTRNRPTLLVVWIGSNAIGLTVVPPPPPPPIEVRRSRPVSRPRGQNTGPRKRVRAPPELRRRRLRRDPIPRLRRWRARVRLPRRIDPAGRALSGVAGRRRDERASS